MGHLRSSRWALNPKISVVIRRGEEAEKVM